MLEAETLSASKFLTAVHLTIPQKVGPEDLLVTARHRQLAAARQTTPMRATQKHPAGTTLL